MTTREYHQNFRIFDVSLDFQLLRYEIRFLDPTEQDGAYNVLHIIWGIFRKNLSRKFSTENIESPLL